MIVRLLSLLMLLTTPSAAASSAARQEAAPPATLAGLPFANHGAPARPKPLRGVPLAGSTGLQLLVAGNPPFLLDVDNGRITPISGLDAPNRSALSVLAVGEDAVVWLDRLVRPANVPTAEIYVVRHGETSAIPLATAWEVAPAADGAAVWLKSYTDAEHCTLREVRLDGQERQTPRPLPCSTRLIDAGAKAFLVEGRSVVDPQTRKTVLRTGGVWAVTRGGTFVLTVAESGRLTSTDLRSRARWQFSNPSQIGGVPDEAAVQPTGRLVALSFANPALGRTQATDVWLLDPLRRRLRELPDMPAVVALKFTSMSWTTAGRLVILARTAGREVVGVWRPGQKRIAVRRVSLPARNSGSDSFVVWP